MNWLKKIIRYIDLASEQSGKIGQWCALLLVLVGSYDTIARHFFNAPTVWGYDMLCMLGGALYLLGASYDYLHDAHTRVDLLYNLLKPRGKALANVLSSLFLFFPLMVVMLYYSVTWTIRAIKINEVMFTSFWYPPAFPYRGIFAIGLFLLVLQGLSRFVRDLYFVIRGEQLD
ncbi:MAG TPA: TRAP transporter small permease subunit [Spirochaetales bacterium]|nr:TRAP transporter small permease subunit [Spirochaetales bacterium]HOV39721.1 TRAP transporter small permease subunit [Spirochaetales bacterium]